MSSYLTLLSACLQLLRIRQEYQELFNHPEGYGWGVYKPADAKHKMPWVDRLDKKLGPLPLAAILSECARRNLSPAIDPAWRQDGIRVAAVGWIDIDGGDGSLLRRLVTQLHLLSYVPWVMNSSAGLPKFHVGLKADAPIPASELRALLCELVELLEPGAIRTNRKGDTGYVDVFPGAKTSVIRPACYAKPGQLPGCMLERGEVCKSFQPLREYLAQHRLQVAPAPPAKCTPEASPVAPTLPMDPPPPLVPGQRNARIAPLVRYYKQQGLLSDPEIIATIQAQAIAAGCGDSDGSQTRRSVNAYLKTWKDFYGIRSNLFQKYLDQLDSHEILASNLSVRTHLLNLLTWARDEEGINRVAIGQEQVRKLLGCTRAAVGMALGPLEREGRIVCVEHHVPREHKANLYQLADSPIRGGGIGLTYGNRLNMVTTFAGQRDVRSVSRRKPLFPIPVGDRDPDYALLYALLDTPLRL